jgi:hypothetical protein
MHFPIALIALIAAASSSSAVTIRNYRTGTCKGTYRQCTNIKAQFYCARSVNPVYSSSRFLGLPTTAIGAICTAKGGKKCGTVKKAGRGLNLCIGNGNSKGSYWFGCRSCSRGEDGELSMAGGAVGEIDVSSLGDAATTIGSVAPDIIAFDGHQFGINQTTPQGVVDTLFQYFDAGADYADLPVDLKVYEAAVGDDVE